MSGKRRGVVVDTGINVFDAALGRMRWLFDEFDGQVTVSFSGGKDSTVVMELAAMVARERGQKLNVQFLDQEAEWQHTRDYLRHVKDTREDINFIWYQIPFRLYNATSYGNEWAHVWDERLSDEEWVRPKEPDSVHENTFGVDRFRAVLHMMGRTQGGAILTGMRVEEAPNRRLGNTTSPCYKWVTWGSGDRRLTKREAGLQRYTMFNPIYDWGFKDVWKAIHEHGWEYNKLYDEMHRYGVGQMDMRVSSLIHTGAVRDLTMAQELDRHTWERMIQRFPGVNTYGHVGAQIEAEYMWKRPYMFDTWHDYLEHLVENLVPTQERRDGFRKLHRKAEERLPWLEHHKIDRQLISQVFRNDHFAAESSFAKWIIVQKNKHWNQTHEEKPL